MFNLSSRLLFSGNKTRLDKEAVCLLKGNMYVIVVFWTYVLHSGDRNKSVQFNEHVLAKNLTRPCIYACSAVCGMHLTFSIISYSSEITR